MNKIDNKFLISNALLLFGFKNIEELAIAVGLSSLQLEGLKLGFLSKEEVTKLGKNYQNITNNKNYALKKIKDYCVLQLEKPTSYALDTKIKYLGLNTEICNALERSKIITIADLCKKTSNELLEIKGISDNRLKIIQLTLKKFGYSIKKEKNVGINGNSPIEILNLYQREIYYLHKSSIITINDICQLTKQELLKIPRIGKYRCDQIENQLNLLNFKLKEEENTNELKKSHI